MALGLGSIEKKIERFKYLAFINRLPGHQDVFSKGRDFELDLKTLKKDGTLVLESFLDPKVLANLQADLKKTVEIDFDFEYPCLSQVRVDSDKHQDIIQKKFKFSNKELHRRGVCFERHEVENYQQLVSQLQPTTLKVSIKDDVKHFNVWLDPYLLKLIEGYMGIVPFLTEAYSRRNFPSQYKVMNHNWHRDMNHEHHLLKAFIFLSDCDLKHGPHEFIIGSHVDRTISGKDYFEESEVDALYPQGSSSRFLSKVKAGTVVLEDTRGLHRASVPHEGYRDLGFAIFVPATFWRPHQNPFYKISEKVFNQLNPAQKKYIPKCSIASELPSKDSLS